MRRELPEGHYVISYDRGNDDIYMYNIYRVVMMIAGDFVPRRFRTQNDWVRILWLIRTRVRIIQRIRTLYITFILITCNICKLMYLCFIPQY